MGILDDAIREHLDLKRRLGAEDGELARLEDEAFGPPTRPGDPDFPGDKTEAAAAVAEPATGEAPVEPPATEPPSEELAAEAPPPEAPLEEVAADPAPDPAPTPVPEPPSEELVAEGDASDVPDHGSDELDLDLDLELDEEVESGEAVPETADQPAVDPTPTPPPAAGPPIESLDTVEHPFEGAIEDTGEAEVVEGELADEPPVEADGEQDEDVLEETPEFLRDAPEDDELWFEQGEPKDFDF